MHDFGQKVPLLYSTFIDPSFLGFLDVSSQLSDKHPDKLLPSDEHAFERLLILASSFQIAQEQSILQYCACREYLCSARGNFLE